MYSISRFRFRGVSTVGDSGTRGNACYGIIPDGSSTVPGDVLDDPIGCTFPGAATLPPNVIGLLLPPTLSSPDIVL